MQLTMASDDVVDTDPLVTEPLVRLITFGHRPPRIPSWRAQLIAAAESFAARFPQIEGVRVDCPGIVIDSCADICLQRIRAFREHGIEGADLWAWLCNEHRHRKWSRSTMQSAIGKLEALRLISNLPGRRNRRRYVATVAA